MYNCNRCKLAAANTASTNNLLKDQHGTKLIPKSLFTKSLASRDSGCQKAKASNISDDKCLMLLKIKNVLSLPNAL